MRNPNYRTLFPSKHAEEPSFTFELILFSIFICPVIWLASHAIGIPGLSLIIFLIIPFALSIPIILIYLIIKNNYNNPLLLEMLLILYIIEFSIVAIYIGGGAWGNPPRPFVNVYLIISAVVLHILAWVAFFTHNQLILRICMSIMIGLAIFNVQYVLTICFGGLFPYGFGLPFPMVTWYNEACIGPTARNWHMDGVILNFFSYIIFSFGIHEYTIFKKSK